MKQKFDSKNLPGIPPNVKKLPANSTLSQIGDVTPVVI